MVVGLGNPGPRYAETRHNVGFRTVERLAVMLNVRLSRPRFKRFEIARASHRGQTVYLARPLTFMNASGEIIRPLLRYAGAEAKDLLVVCDSLDLPTGVCRLKTAGSSGGQKGLESILRSVGTREIARLVIGIGRPAAEEGGRDAVVSYVLGRARGGEAATLEAAVDRAADAVLRLAHESPERVMSDVNRVVGTDSQPG